MPSEINKPASPRTPGGAIVAGNRKPITDPFRLVGL